MNVTPKFFYLRNRKNHPVVCIAYYEPEKNNSLAKIKYAYTVWNPVDKFDRRMGRMIAKGRLDSHPFETDNYEADTKRDIIEDLCGRVEEQIKTLPKDLPEEKDSPNKKLCSPSVVHQLAKRWLSKQ